MSEMETWARLYRCRKCNKWSHAKRKPKKHQRWVDAWSSEYDPSKNENPGYDGDYNNLADGHFVDCGPFDYWYACYQGFDTKDGNPK